MRNKCIELLKITDEINRRLKDVVKDDIRRKTMEDMLYDIDVRIYVLEMFMYED